MLEAVTLARGLRRTIRLPRARDGDPVVRADRLIRQHYRDRYLVTLASGEAFEGVLSTSTRATSFWPTPSRCAPTASASRSTAGCGCPVPTCSTCSSRRSERGAHDPLQRRRRAGDAGRRQPTYGNQYIYPRSAEPDQRVRLLRRGLPDADVGLDAGQQDRLRDRPAAAEGLRPRRRRQPHPGRDTPFAKLLRNPNPKHDPFFFWLWTVSTHEVYGEAMWVKVRPRPAPRRRSCGRCTRRT
jgi:hypothetical protein